MKKTIAVSFLLTMMLSVTPLLAQQTTTTTIAKAPEPAQKMIDAATKRAKTSGKSVLVLYHASWCGWCKRLEEKLISDAKMGKVLTSHYEIVHLDVMESPDKKSLENAGGNDLMAKMGGAKAGLPFYAIFDTAGKKLGDSNRMPGNQNIGYPGSADEITAFVQLLKETAPKISDAELTQIGDHLRKNAPTQ